MKISPKIEDYLETIYRLSTRNDTVGVSDVAKARNVSVPTARTAVNRLQEYGFLHQKHYGKIILHESGVKKAKEIFKVHKTLRRFLTHVLGVDNDLAEKEACKMEHGLSLPTLEKLDIFMKALESSKDNYSAIMGIFRELKERNESSDECFDDGLKHRELETMTLLDLKPGASGIITKICGCGRIRHRMIDLGLHVGEKVAMIKTAPLKDPVEFAFNGNHVSLRRSEAELIQIITDAKTQN